MPKARGRDQGARRLAWEVLWRTYRDGAYPDLLLASRLGRGGDLPDPDRRLASELVFGTIRWQGTLDRALSRVSARPLDGIHPKLLILLRIGAYQILFLDRIPARAAINESVELARSIGLAHAVSFVNAVLREVHRQGPVLTEVDPALPVAERIAQESSHPLWMVEYWMAQWGEMEARALCRANNEVPPLSVRTNTLKITREGLSEALRTEGVECVPTPYSPEGLRLMHVPRPLFELRSFRRGEFQVQDEAAQLISHWLHVTPGQRILDACAAPGGKGTHLGQLTGQGAQVVSVDLHRGRLRMIARECRRLGITSVEALCADLQGPPPLALESFDRILLDAPCTGLGVIRRHPDTKWRRGPGDVHRMASIQKTLMKALLPLLKEGGIILYSVCTHTREESQEVLEWILQEVKGFRLLLTPDGLPEHAHHLVGRDGVFRTFPHRHAMDGFTAFRLQRS